jgi:hypothetical protein
MAGLGAAAFAFLLYKKHQHQVEDFLHTCGFACGARSEDLSELSLRELRERMEHLEDAIAEREVRAETMRAAGE